MPPKGNRTGKGGTCPVGGYSSKGTVQLSLRISSEMHKEICKRIGKEKSVSDYIRECVEKDLTN
jgi:hypothetical protein